MKKETNPKLVTGGGQMERERTSTINICLHGAVHTVLRSDYVRAKTKDLREFGYPELTEAEVNEQVTAIQEGRKLGKGLTVIGKFMEDDICL